tara:strand:- start:8445 stop:11924 length:3480 start_codon:yes stop_codon:yes gene_type:complete
VHLLSEFGSFNSLVPKNWLTAFLDSRKIQYPDGRPLFAYQIDNKEFEHIGNCLSFSAALSAENINKRLPNWDALFVLYASLWWRSNYQGGAWSWENILSSLELSQDEFGHKVLRSLVTTGLKYWKRELLINSQGRQFLGTIIFEGGIPLGLLTQNSNFDTFLKGVLKDSIEFAGAGLTPTDFALRRKDMLATAYQKEEFLILVGEVINTVISLKLNNGLSSQQDPVAHLDNVLPNWRTLFPISIEGPEGNTLINSLIRQSSKVKKKANAPIYLKRSLTFSNQSWALGNEVYFPKTILEEDLQEFWQVVQCGNKIDIIASNGGNKVNLAVLTLYRSGEFQVSPLVKSLPESNSPEDWLLCFYRKGKAISELLPLKGGEAIEPDLPLGFELNQSQQWTLVCQGNVSTTKDKLRVVLPELIDPARFGQVKLGELPGSRSIIELTDNTDLPLDGNEIYHFKVKSENPANNNIVYRMWSDRTLTQKNSSNAVFLGFPSITKIIAGSLLLNVEKSTVFWRVRGGAWQFDLNKAMGLVDIAVIDDGKIVYRKKVVVLPKDLNVSFKSHTEQFNRGEIFFNSALIRSVSAQLNERVIQGEEVNGVICLDVCSDEPQHQLNVTLDLIGSANPINVEFPFPSSGARFMRVDGVNLKDGMLVTLSELNSIMLDVQHNDPTDVPRYSLDLKLQSNDKTSLLNKAQSSVKLILESQQLSDGLNLQLPLIDKQLHIKRLFALSEDLDAHIKVAIRRGSDVLAHFDVVRYSLTLDSEETASGRVLYLIGLEGNYDNVENCNYPDLIVKALHYPEERGFVVPRHEVAGIKTDQWLLQNLSKHNGPWLVYEPQLNSRIRPKLIFVTHPYHENSSDETKGSPLREAICEGTHQARIFKLDNAIQNLVDDDKHPDWSLIDAYISSFNTLPLTTFDLWDRFIKNEYAMADLYFRYIDDPTKSLYIDNFAEELPFLWESISANAWKSSFSKKKNLLSEKLAPYENGHTMLVELCLKWLKSLGETGVTSLTIVKYLNHQVLGKVDDLFSVFKTDGAIEIANNFLMAKVEDSHYQKLVRSNSEESWPSLEDELSTKLTVDCDPKVMKLLQLIVSDLPPWRSSVVLTPLLLGIMQANKNHSALITSGIDVLSLRNIMHFDPEWFATAYLVGFSFAIGQLNNHE